MKYKVLMIGTAFVNERELNRGIYATITPALHNEDFSEDDLIKQWANYSILANDPVIDAVKNIKKCELKTVEIKILN
jgi:hypothetical protein